MKFAVGRILLLPEFFMQTAETPKTQKTFSTKSDGIIIGAWV